MIFDLSSAFIQSTRPNQLSDLVAQIVYHHHFLTIPGDVTELLWSVIESNSSSTQTLLWLQSVDRLIPTVEIKAYQTTVTDGEYSYDELFVLASKPSVLLMENTREWNVYKSLIQAYVSDPEYGNLFKHLQLLLNEKYSPCLLPRQSGGFSEIPQCLCLLSDTEGYGRALKRKVYVVVDRDTSSEVAPFNEDKKSMIKALCGKTHLTLSNGDIYSLTQSDYIWHMWYRRSIENYFPDSAFSAIGRTLKTGAAPFESDYYAKVEDHYAHGRVTKSVLKNDIGFLANYMTRSLWNANLQVFSLSGKNYNEMQLFLLKLIKVV